MLRKLHKTTMRTVRTGRHFPTVFKMSYFFNNTAVGVPEKFHMQQEEKEQKEERKAMTIWINKREDGT